MPRHCSCLVRLFSFSFFSFSFADLSLLYMTPSSLPLRLTSPVASPIRHASPSPCRMVFAARRPSPCPASVALCLRCASPLSRRLLATCRAFHACLRHTPSFLHISRLAPSPCAVLLCRIVPSRRPRHLLRDMRKWRGGV